MRKLSLHLGINKFSPDYYGDGNDLRGCENDAKFLKSFSDSKGFKSDIYLSKEATYDLYIRKMNEAANELESGDIFFFTASCHGTYKDEANERKTALCLYDRIVWDDETKNLLAKFKKGVLVVWMTDCCHSRDNFKSLARDINNGRIRSLNFDDIRQTVEEPEITKHLDLKCNIIAYSSSTEQQVSYDLKSLIDNRPMGLFTASLEKILSEQKNRNLSFYLMYKRITETVQKQNYPQTPKLQVVNGHRERLLHKTFLL